MWCIGLSSFTCGSDLSPPTEGTVSEERAFDLRGLLSAPNSGNRPELNVGARQPLTRSKSVVLLRGLVSRTLTLDDEKVVREMLARQPLTLDEREVFLDVQTHQPLTPEEEKVLRKMLAYQSFQLLTRSEKDVVNKVWKYQSLTQSERLVLSRVQEHQSLTLEEENVIRGVLARQPLTLSEIEVLREVLVRQSFPLNDGNVLRKVLAYQPLTLSEIEVLLGVQIHQPLTLEEEKVLRKVLAYQSLPFRDTPNASGSSNRQKTSHVVLSEPTYDAIIFGLIIILVICPISAVIAKCFRPTPALSNSLEMPIDSDTPTDAAQTDVPMGNPPFILAPMIRKKKESADKTTFTADEFKEYLENESTVNTPDRMILEVIDTAAEKSIEKSVAAGVKKGTLNRDDMAGAVAEGLKQWSTQFDMLVEPQKDKAQKEQKIKMLLQNGMKPINIARHLDPKGDDVAHRKESRRISNNANRKSKKPKR
jgi:hypothetical protein